MASAGIGTDVEGFHAVEAAAASGRVRRLLVESKRLADDRYRVLVERVRAGGSVVEEVDDVRPHATTTSPQGLVAICLPIPPTSLDAAVAVRRPAALVVLDRVVDPRNVGAIARTALAAGMGAMVVSRDRAAPLGASTFKAAAGALEKLPVVVVHSVAEAVSRLDDADVWTVGLDNGGDRSLLDLDLLAEPCALVVGAEGSGLSHLVAERVSVTARLPMAGDVESLNASVAASLAMFELARRRGWLE